MKKLKWKKGLQRENAQDYPYWRAGGEEYRFAVFLRGSWGVKKKQLYDLHCNGRSVWAFTTLKAAKAVAQLLENG